MEYGLMFLLQFAGEVKNPAMQPSRNPLWKKQTWADEKGTSVLNWAKNAVSLPTGSSRGQSGAELGPTRPFKQVKTNEKGTSIWSGRGHSISFSAQCASQRRYIRLKGAQWGRGASLNNELPAAQLLSIMAAFILTGRECVFMLVCVWMFVFLCT